MVTFDGWIVYKLVFEVFISNMQTKMRHCVTLDFPSASGVQSCMMDLRVVIDFSSIIFTLTLEIYPLKS